MSTVLENILEGPCVEDALGPEALVLGRGGPQALLDADAQKIHTETLGDLTLENRTPVRLRALRTAYDTVPISLKKQEAERIPKRIATDP